METVFTLQHAYELDGHDEVKFIGVYATSAYASGERMSVAA